jgi:RNA polymerase sigma factor (sigma-70 family)
MAEEAVQAVFIVLARRAGKVRGETLPGWLFQVARRAADRLRRAETRRKEREREVTRMAATSAQGGPDGAEREEVRTQLQSALDSLPADQRNCLVMHFFCGKTHREIAGALSCGESTIQMRIQAGLQKLRGLLSRRGLAVSGVVLSACLLECSQAAPPPGLTETVASAALAKTSASAAAMAAATEVLRALFWAKALKIAAVIAVAVLLGTGGLVMSMDRSPPCPGHDSTGLNEKIVTGTVLVSCPQGRFVKVQTAAGEVRDFPVACPVAKEAVKGFRKGQKVTLTYAYSADVRKDVVVAAEGIH